MRRGGVPAVVALVAVAVAAGVLVVQSRGAERSVVDSNESGPVPSFEAFPEPVADADPPGPRAVEIPSRRSDDLVVTPEDDVAAIIASAPVGATIRFTSGTYRELEIEPKDDQTYIAEPGAVLNGSRVLTGFRREGAVWTLGGQVHGSPEAVEGNEWGFCDEDRPACVFPEELFVDGERLLRVPSERAVEPETWYFDYEGDRIIVGTDPTGRQVETSVARWAFHGESDRVEIRGFEIVQYASPGRQGSINPRRGGRIGPAGRSWTVVGNTFRNSHGWAVKMEDGMTLADNVIAGGGQGGVGGVAEGVLIEHNLIEGNCTAGFRCLGWEGGALKLSTSDATIRANVVRGNFGHGLHTDIDCVDVVIEANLVVDNQGAGIHHEISGRAAIRSNTVVGNGYRPDGERDAGIFVLSSSDVLVEDNVVERNANGIFLRQDHRTSEGLLERVVVRGNEVIMGAGAKSGFAFSERALFVDPSAAQIVFEANRYVLTEGVAEEQPFQADDDRLDVDGWRTSGRDVDGSFVVSG